MEVLEQDLEAPTSSLANGNVGTNGDKSALRQEWRLMRMRNAVMIVSRIPLEPISLQQKNLLFKKLLELDQAIISGKLGLPLKKILDKTDLLVVLRRAMSRFVSAVARDTVEVIHSLDNISFTGYSAYR
jgi:hypothetical protein